MRHQMKSGMSMEQGAGWGLVVAGGAVGLSACTSILGGFEFTGKSSSTSSGATGGAGGGVQVAGGTGAGTPSASSATSSSGGTGGVDAGPPLTWAKDFGSAGNTQRPGGMAVDAMGNVVFGGGMQGALTVNSTSLINAGGLDALVVKLDKYGNTVWAQRFGDASDQVVTAVAVNASGDVFVAGGFSGEISFGGATYTASGAGSTFIARFNAAGVFQWSNAYTGYIVVGGLGSDQFGNVVIAGDFSGTVNFGMGAISSSAASGAGASMFVAKLAVADGSEMWGEAFSGMQNDNSQFPSSVAVDSAGNVVVGGYVNQDVTFGNTATITTGGFVVKLDTSGNVMWSASVSTDCALGCNNGGTGVGYVGVAVDSLGDVIVGSATLQYIMDGGFSEALGFDLTKYSSSGPQIWQDSYAPGGQDYAAVAVAANDDILMSGRFGPSINIGGGTLTAPSSTADVFLGRFSAAGVNAWSFSFGETGARALTPIAATPAGNLAFLASHTGTANFGAGSLTAAGPVDFVVGVIAP